MRKLVALVRHVTAETGAWPPTYSLMIKMRWRGLSPGADRSLSRKGAKQSPMYLRSTCQPALDDLDPRGRLLHDVGMTGFLQDFDLSAKVLLDWELVAQPAESIQTLDTHRHLRP